ncbi:MAG: argininosuccinate lyase, partial [Vicinamibacteria bacterium]|nr:argininosuccinate lyase [Vicinamibacteria bacterium]
GHIGRIVQGLCEQGSHAADAVMPGFTHTRLAEPITFGHFAGAHAWALVRDIERLADARRRVDVLPLGSGALAGTALPIDREALARDLGFGAVSENALDAVMDRDFAIEVVFVCAQIQHHLSRLAEDLIWQSGPEFGFFRIPEAFTTGSSLMPQKKNPDALELIRGKTGRVLGALVGSLEITKGLPTGYQKDLQEDKEAVFDALDTTLGSALVMAGVIAGLEIHRARMRAAAAHEEMMAAGLAVAIAREGVPFRKAHGIVGRLVAESQRTGESLKKTAARLLPGEAPAVVAQIEALFDPDQAVRMKAARGGTAPQAVLASLAAARQRVEDLKER